MKIVCAAPSCKYSAENVDSSDIIFISFPDDDTSTIWAHNCGRPDLIIKSNEELHMNYYICSNHIEDRYYLSKTNIIIAQGAIPTLFPSHNGSPEHFTPLKEQYSTSDHVISGLQLNGCIETVSNNCPSTFVDNTNSNYSTTIYNSEINNANHDIERVDKHVEKQIDNDNNMDYCNMDINIDHFDGMTMRFTNLCRLCGQSTSNGTDIIGERGIELKLKDKINLHLPILIENDDDELLPLKMCPDCYEKLEAFHLLVITCLQTDIRLRRYLNLPSKYNHADKFRQIISVYEMRIDNEMCTDNSTDGQIKITTNKSKDLISINEDFNVEDNKNLFSHEILNTQSAIQYHEHNSSISSSKVDSRLKFMTHSDLNTLILQPLHSLDNSSNKNQPSEALIEENIENNIDTGNELNCSESTHKFDNRDENNKALTLTENNTQSICTITEVSIFETNKSIEEHNMFANEQINKFNCKKCDEKFNKYEELISHEELHSESNNPQQKRRCGYCSLGFINRKQLQCHISENHAGQRILFKCGLCDKVYEKWSSLDVHEATHRQDKPYLCDLCGKSFKHSNNLRGHKRIHLDITKKKRHVCETCGNAFRSRFHLREHMNQHNGNKPYNCEQCGKAFSKRIQLRQHRLSHGLNKYACPICAVTFNRRGNMNTHLKRHNNNDGMYTCSVCACRCKSMSELKMHRKQHSENDIIESIKKKCNNKIIWECKICARIFPKHAALLNHKRTHDSDETRVECDKCGKKLASKNSLKCHTKSMHTTERPHSCQFCGESFVSKEARLIHERIHTGERPYICKLCNMQYRCSSNLSQHMKVHLKIRPYVCQYCDKTFARKDAMSIHERIHTGSSKPFACDICEQKFSQKNDMIKHAKTHEVDLSLECEECNEIFSTKNRICEHFQNFHKPHINNLSVIDSSIRQSPNYLLKN